MKKHVLLILSIVIATVLFVISEIDLKIQNTNIKKYKMLAKSKLLQEKRVKFDGAYLYEEYHSKIRTKDYELKPGYRNGYKTTELLKAQNASVKYFRNHIQAKFDWVERGPANVGGRTRAIYIDPDDPLGITWIAGSVSGGLWKTSDKGVTWRNLTPDIPNLAISCLAYSESNPNIIYAGTGEGFMNVDGVNGDGILKSTDRGESWSILQSSLKFKSVNRIIVDPSDPNKLLSCSNDMDVSSKSEVRFFSAKNSTIQKSTNGGLTWRMVYESGSDRIQQIIFDPNDFKNQYASVNSTGIIKSTNEGETWFDASNGLGGKSRIEMAMSPTDPQRIYLSVENGANSDLYVTYDGAKNWYFANDIKKNYSWLSNQGWYDNCIAVNPYNPDQVFVGGVNIFRLDMQAGTDSIGRILSIDKTNLDTYMDFYDAGLSYENGGIGTGENFWEEKLINDDEYTTIELRFGPGFKQKAHRFLMVGETQFQYQDYVEVPFVAYDLKNSKQLMISFADMNMNGKFDLTDDEFPEGVLIHTLKYDNKPSEQVKVKENYKCSYVITPTLKDGAVWDPDNIPVSKLKINWGSVYTKRRETTFITDGYGQFGNPNTNNKVHVDQHNITIVPLDKDKESYRLVIGNDGGVAWSDNKGLTWKETDQNGYNTSQFYGCDKKHGANEYIGGTQDNGTWLSRAGENASKSSKYKSVIGGDGFEAAWHYKNPDLIIGSSQYNTILKSTDGGESWNYSIEGLYDVGQGYGPFISKIAKSNSDPDLLFAVGKTGIARSENFGNNWKTIPIPDSLWSNNGYFSNAQVEISIANPQIVWAGINMSDNGRIHISKDAGLSFNSVNIYDLVKMGRISGIETHPLEEATAFALFSFAASPKILKTTDYGNSWNDISGYGSDSVSNNGFPDVAVYSLIVMPYNTKIIWVGTEIGLIESIDGGKSWHLADNGLPAISIWQMRIVDDQVVIATHGRGIWSVTLPELVNYKPPDVVLFPTILQLGQTPARELAVKSNLRSVYDSTKIYTRKLNSQDDFEIVQTIGSNVEGFQKIKVKYNNSEYLQLEVYIKSYKNGKDYRSDTYQVALYPLDKDRITYKNDFELSKMGFGGFGFTIDTISGFSGSYLQTQHNYPDEISLMNLLLTPIIVADSLADFIYDDIAVVEPGDSGSVFGEASFFDYVVVEATNDGFEWKPMPAGYDANFDPYWLSAYENEIAVSQDMLRKHKINLLDYFNKRDTILIRFRLYADQHANGWGWAIDNVNIQENPYMNINDFVHLNKSSMISRILPNPISDKTSIEIFNSHTSKIKLNIYDQAGHKVVSLIDGILNEGSHIVNWYPSSSLSNGIYFIMLESGETQDVRKITINR